MKKLFNILFISAYLVFNVGISVATHFCCCGTDSTLAVSYTQPASKGDDCYDNDCQTQACLTEIVSLKITDLHISAPVDDAADQPCEAITFFSPDDGLNASHIISAGNNSSFSYSGPPVYLSNCTFRI